MGYVFISYSRANVDFVRLLRDDINKYGFEVWMDETNIRYGEDWWQAIIQAIEDCSALMVIMTPDAEKSIYVRKEIIAAEKRRKHLIPYLVNGDCLEILSHLNYYTAKKERNYLPSINFYDNLKRHVPRSPRQVEKPDFQVTHLKQLGRFIPEQYKRPEPPVRSTHINVSDWTEYVRAGSNDFYGIAMLALSYEAHGEHRRAMVFFRKAQKLEPRLCDKAWMSKHFNWTEEHHKLVETIIIDSDFWSTPYNL